ncbi:MAG TPA: hypothetical protein EYG51_24020 [Pseudomonadales bacterium]|nr:hypothetical protein [Pseudomonadales bacterium]
MEVGDLVRMRLYPSDFADPWGIGLAVELDERPRPIHLRHRMARRFDVAVLWSGLDDINWEDSDNLEVVDEAR